MTKKNPEERLLALEQELQEARAGQVWGFYEGSVPLFVQGDSQLNELCELVTAKEVTGYVNVIEKCNQQLKKALMHLEDIMEHHPEVILEDARKFVEELKVTMRNGKNADT